MSRATATIYCNGQEIRKYGGNKSDCRSMRYYYENMTLEQFLNKHPHLTEDDYKGLKVTYYHRN